MHRTQPAVLAGLLLAALVGAAHAEDVVCLRMDGTPQALAGTVRSIEVYGAKRYGAKPAKDAVDTAILLVLDQPACVVADGIAATHDVRALQLGIDSARAATLRSLVGRHVAIDGPVRKAATVTDRTAFVFDVADLRETPGGNRLESASTSSLLASGRIPVVIGTRGPRAYACTGIARLSGSSPGVLRERGSEHAGSVATMSHGDAIHLCETTPDGEWFGVVVKPERKTKIHYCDVTTPVATPQPYRGRCLSGWLRTDEVMIEAG
jgi:hypothetical protein